MRGSILLWLGVAVLLGLAGCSPQENVLCKDYCDRQQECCEATPGLPGCEKDGEEFDRQRCRRDCPEVFEERVLSPNRDGGTLCTNEKERRRVFQETCLYEDCDKLRSCIENQIPDCEG